MIRCAGCEKEIKGKYIQAMGGNWHPDCFRCDLCGVRLDGRYHQAGGEKLCPACFADHHAPRCAACGKPILGNYVSALGKVWHPDCLRCTACGRKLTDEQFHEQDGKPWCIACWEAEHLPRCAVCGVTLHGEYRKDLWGNVFCPKHETRPGVCDYCGRIMAEGVTEGGKRYRDGRRVCNLCRETAVTDVAVAEGFGSLVRRFFDKRGLSLEPSMPLKLVCPAGMPKGHRGESRLGTIVKKVTTTDGRETGREVESVLILEGMPAEKLCEVLAHEYGHAWLFLNGYPELPLQVEEGVAQLFAHAWLSERGTVFGSMLKRGAEENPDPVYGDGLRSALKGLRRMGMADLLAWVRAHRDLP